MNIPPEIERIIMYYYQCSMRDKKTKNQVIVEINEFTGRIKYYLEVNKIDNNGKYCYSWNKAVGHTRTFMAWFLYKKE